MLSTRERAPMSNDYQRLCGRRGYIQFISRPCVCIHQHTFCSQPLLPCLHNLSLGLNGDQSGAGRPLSGDFLSSLAVPDGKAWPGLFSHLLVIRATCVLLQPYKTAP